MLKAWLLAALLTSGMALAGEPVAMVTDISGDAWLQGRGKESKLNVLSYIEPGESIRLGAKTRITLTTFAPATEYVAHGPARLKLAGGEFRLSGRGKIEKRPLPQTRAAAAQKFSSAQRERVTMAALEMRGGEGGLRLLAPVDAALLNLKPVFRWAAPQRVRRFVVTVFDESENAKLAEVTVSEPRWQLPSGSSLQHGHEYIWQVRAVPDSGVERVVTASFSIVDETRAQQIVRQKPPADAPFSERLLYAVLLDSEGLVVDAADEWITLAAERPHDPTLARQAKRLDQGAR